MGWWKRIRNKLLLPPRFMEWKLGRSAPLVPPERIYVETTNRCNLRCPQCPTGLRITGRKEGEMEEPLFRAVVDEIHPFAATAVLHIWGEPLLNPRLEGFIAYAAKKGLATEISTNAMLLDEARTRALIRSGLSRIYLCIDGMDAATYEKIRVGGDFERVRRNIENFIRLNLEAGEPVAVRVQIIHLDLTRDQVERFRRTWSVRGVEGVNIKAFDSWGGKVERINALNRDGEAPPLPPRYPCPNLWYHAHIYHDGTLVCCDRDFGAVNPLGNVRRGVLRAWRGERMQALRRAHVLGRIETEPCKECREWAWWRPGPFTAWGNAPMT